MNRLVFQAALLLMGSGFCALVYQTVWFRMLRLVFGGTTAATSAVLAIFLGGLGLGSWALGRYVERDENPMRLYAKLEAGIAVSAALTPFLIAAVGAIYLSSGGSPALGGPASTALRLALATIALGVPAFLMGGTLPALARAVETGEDDARSSVSLLYGMNTLGAVTGVLVTTFVAIEMFGSRATLWSAAGLNLAVAAIAWMWATGRERTGETTGTPGPPPSPGVLAAAAAVGFAFLLMELVWYRMLAPILGGSTYTFGLILATALLGIGVGGLLYAATQRDTPTWSSFASTCGLEALLLGIPYALGDRIAVAAMLVWPLSEASFPALVLGWTLLTTLVVLPAAIVAGYQFPLLVALAGQGDQDVGRDVGYVYAANTFGSILGSLAGGFGLLPWFGAPTLWRLTTVGLATLAMGVLIIALARRPVGPLRILTVTLTALLALATWRAEGPTALWRHSGIGLKTLSPPIGSPNEARDRTHEIRRGTAWEREGVEAAIAVNTPDGISLIVNGKSDGHVRHDAPTQILAGLVAAARHPKPRRVLIIGLGTGETTGWVAAMDEVERVDVIEIEPAVVAVAAMAHAANLDALRSPKVHVILGDAREVILSTDQTWDLIISEPSNPYRVGVASLFTQDFYRVVQSRLAPGGLFAQWVQAYAVDAAAVRTAFATLGSVYDQVETWEMITDGDMLFLATSAPLPHDLQRIRRLAAEPPLRTALNRIDGVDGAEGFYAGFVGTPALTHAVLAAHSGPLHTDDRPVFEFGVARSARAKRFRLDEVRDTARTLGAHRPDVDLDWAIVDELRSLRFAAHAVSSPPRPDQGHPEARSRALARIAYQRGRVDDARLLWERQSGAARGPIDMVMLGEAYGRQGDDRVGRIVQRLLELGAPAEASFVAATFHHAHHNQEETSNALAEAFVALRTDPWCPPAMVQRGLRLASDIAALKPAYATQLTQALQEPFAARVLDDPRRVTRIHIEALRQDPASCIGAWAELEPHIPWRLEELQARQRCYEAAAHPLAPRAAADVAAFLRAEPTRFADGMTEDRRRR